MEGLINMVNYVTNGLGEGELYTYEGE